MPPTFRFSGRILLAGFALACASNREEPEDAASGAEHDPALHAEHAGKPAPAPRDTSFTALQARGATGMGVDQYSSTHTFETTPEGGRITLRRDVDDRDGVEQIRVHLRSIAAAFAKGDFTTPSFVHAATVPGTGVMAARRALIRYNAAPIEHGGELVITTSDSVALDAIHRFLAFQRKEHRAGGESAPPRGR